MRYVSEMQPQNSILQRKICICKYQILFSEVWAYDVNTKFYEINLYENWNEPLYRDIYFIESAWKQYISSNLVNIQIHTHCVYVSVSQRVVHISFPLSFSQMSFCLIFFIWMMMSAAFIYL